MYIGPYYLRLRLKVRVIYSYSFFIMFVLMLGLGLGSGRIQENWTIPANLSWAVLRIPSFGSLVGRPGANYYAVLSRA